MSQYLGFVPEIVGGLYFEKNFYTNEKKRRTKIKSKELALKCVEIVEDKKASDVIVLDLEKLSSLTTYFVICFMYE